MLYIGHINDPELAKVYIIIAILMFFICGIICIVYYSKKSTNNATIGTLLTGIVMSILAVISAVCLYFDNIKMIIFILGLSTSILLPFYVVQSKILNKKCTERIPAKLCYFNYAHKTTRIATPVFKYDYKGKSYTMTSRQLITSKQILELKNNSKCHIYINPDKPQINIYEPTNNKKMQILYIITGIVVFALSIFYFIIT